MRRSGVSAPVITANPVLKDTSFYNVAELNWYYFFDDYGNSEVVRDLKTGNPPPELVNNVTLEMFSGMLYGKFNGLDSFVKIPDSVDNPFTATLTYLVYPTTEINSQVVSIGSDFPSTTNNQGWGYYNSTRKTTGQTNITLTNTVVVQYNNGTGSYQVPSITKTDIPLAPMRVVVLFDFSGNNRHCVYVNKQLVGLENYFGRTRRRGKRFNYIGANMPNNNNTTLNSHFTGYIKEVALINRVLTVSEINEL
jgi:hypothetical protein